MGGNAVGIFVHSVDLDSPAYNIGLRCADQILEYNGTDLRNIGLNISALIDYSVTVSCRLYEGYTLCISINPKEDAYNGVIV